MIAETDMTGRLANLLQTIFGDKTEASHNKVDMPLAYHAAARHRIAPLLHVLLKQGHFELDDETAAYLQNSYRHAGMFALQQQSLRKWLEQMFSEIDVPYLELKGRGLAEQLYDDPAARFSKDIDILIHKEDQQSVLSAFYEQGFLRSRDGPRFNRRKAAIDMWALKDTTLFDPKFGQHIELHQRPFLTETGDLGAALMLDTGADITPKIDNDLYILYLILHGAHTHWGSLKWIWDIVLLFRKNTPEKADEIFRLAELYHCTSAVSASIDFVADILPGGIDENWLRLAAKYRTPKSRKLQTSFSRTLFSPPDRNSMKRAGFPFADWYIYDGGIDYLREASRRLMRPFVGSL